MTKRMLIDATHAEETRVVVLDGNRLEDFDVETSTKKQLKGNIYLAKIVRVEPSLQAAFVEYGGGRHGFLAFGEIHPDYYQIPIADRQRLVAQQEQEAREAEEADDAAARDEERDQDGVHVQAAGPATGIEEVGDIEEAGNPEPLSGSGEDVPDVPPEPPLGDWPVTTDAPALDPLAETDGPAQPILVDRDILLGNVVVGDVFAAAEAAGSVGTEPVAALAEMRLSVAEDGRITGDPQAMEQLQDLLSDDVGEDIHAVGPEVGADDTAPPAPPPETLGGETEASEERERREPPRYLRNYKIQEVIRRRQIMLVQVVKEERGGKGAALTTYISLAGRFCVLMPNSPRGGGISRKITSSSDRRRLKEITTELAIPSGMGLIVRTAGAARPKPEIRRDCEYLLQLWDDIRDTTMKSVAPAAIYEEASLIKRAIRDVYSRDVDEVQVDGEAAWRAARDQMRLLMPSHAHKVQLWQDSQPLFAHHAVDAQLDAMLSPTVQLKSGGYLVINQTEALVAIDVNSGRSTRERGIEETALRTNSEAAEEVARQLRLRDLAGLIVIDFIDMEARRNNATVERKLKDALKNDRARIQLGSISHFGLMEMSRQRLRPSLAETSFVQCTHCGGTGSVRSTEGASIHVLRAIEEEGGKRKAAEIMVHVAGPVAMYILNHKRERLAEIETRYSMAVVFTPDPVLLPPAVKIDRLRLHEAGAVPPIQQRPAASAQVVEADVYEAPDIEDEEEAETVPMAPRTDAGQGAVQPAVPGAPAGETADGARRRRRRRRRGGRRDEAGQNGDGRLPSVAEPGAEQPDLPPSEFGTASEPGDVIADAAAAASETGSGDVAAAMPEARLFGGDSEAAEEQGAPRRRGRRGGRRRRKDGSEPGATEPAVTAVSPDAAPAQAAPFYAPPVYDGPTPANPFGGGAFDIFDALERAEAAAEAAQPETIAAPAPVRSPEPAAVVEPLAEPEPVAEPVAPEAAAPQPMPVEPEVSAVRAKTPRAPRVRASRAKVQPVPAQAEPDAGLFAVTPADAESALPQVPAGNAAAVADAPLVAAEPLLEPAGAEAAAGPLVRPVLVDEAPPAPRRGWWKR